MSDTSNPFASPAETPEGMLAPLPYVDPAYVIPYASARPRAKWAVAMLALIMVMTVVSLVSTGMQLGLLHRMRIGQFTQEEAVNNDARQQMMGFAISALMIGSIVAFLMWMHRAHRNLPSLGARGLKYTPGWAVGWWFIPFFNIVRPCQVMFEIWRGSDPAGLRPSQGPWDRGSSAALVGWWWAFHLIMGIAGQASLQIVGSAPSLDTLILSSRLALVDGVVTLVAGLLAIRVVRRVTAHQEERFRLLTGGRAQNGSNAAGPFGMTQFLYAF